MGETETMTTNNLLKKEILQLIYKEFYKCYFIRTDIKNLLCRNTGMSSRVVDTHFRYLLRKNYIKKIQRSEQYRFIVPIEEWSFGGEVH
jgi:hypothetical protein